jgi:hypothetical protein
VASDSCTRTAWYGQFRNPDEHLVVLPEIDKKLRFWRGAMLIHADSGSASTVSDSPRRRWLLWKDAVEKWRGVDQCG